MRSYPAFTFTKPLPASSRCVFSLHSRSHCDTWHRRQRNTEQFSSCPPSVGSPGCLSFRILSVALRQKFATSFSGLYERGREASNEQGLWAWPGGEVEFGETLTTAIRRELREEFDMVIEPLRQIAAFDHLLEGGREHWVSVAFVARHISGEPCIKEPGKCSDFGWFSLDHLPARLTVLSQEHLQAYYRMFGVGRVRDLLSVGRVGRSFTRVPRRASGGSGSI